MTPVIDHAFVRRAVSLADPNALRLTMFQLTGDERLLQLQISGGADAKQRAVGTMDPGQRAWLDDLAVDWLMANAGPRDLPEPPEPQLRRMMDVVAGGRMGDLEFEARRDLTGFKAFPYMADWTGDRPDIPDGFSVAVIGSGFAGIGMGVQLDMLGIPYTIYERRHEPGGVWSINNYPDVRVDTMSITYEFMFERDFAWSEYFGRGPEVRDYLARTSRRRGVWDKTRFGHDLKCAAYDEARDKWLLEFDTSRGPVSAEANVVVSAAGLFATPRIIDFPGREDFRGTIVHTAQWRGDIDLKGKRVATIGNGSTGVQMLGAIAREAEHVSVFQRTPQWISPRERYGEPIEREIEWLRRNLPGFWNWWRYSSTASLFETHELMTVDRDWQAKGGKVNAQNDAMRDFLTAYIKAETGGREDLIEKLLPDYAPFSRRPIVDNGWYRALTRDNVELVTDGIERFTPDGIRTSDGREVPFDVIVTATGYDVAQYLWPTHYIGRDGRDLHEVWSEGDGPRAYIGMMMPGFPNFFMLYGPNSQPLSGGPSTPTWFVTWGAYAARCIIRMLESGASSVDVTQDAHARYNAALDEEATKLVQMSDEGGRERNYYLGGGDKDRLLVSAPWYSPYYYRLCSKVEWTDLVFGTSGREEARETQAIALAGEGR
jgi:4-hydroxyacetophenone monooxygenase